MQCPRKIYYSLNKEYANTNDSNDFLKALAEGGFQVGELAKLYHPRGVDIQTLDYEEAKKLTTKELTKEEATIYEAALSFENLFVRVDVLKKQGNHYELIEVKSKSTDEGFFHEIWQKSDSNKLASGYKEYMLDIAFQFWVAKHALPKDAQVTAKLMLCDKSKHTSVEGLHQLFSLRINPKTDRKECVVNHQAHTKDLGEPILTAFDVTGECLKIFDVFSEGGKGFEQWVATLSKICEANSLPDWHLSHKCNACEFLADETQLSQGLKHGRHQCMSEIGGLSPTQLEEQPIFNVWSLHYTTTNRLIKEGRLLLKELSYEDLLPRTPNPKSDGRIETWDRKWLQVEAAIKREKNKEFILLEALGEEFAEFKYPLHFIDFETSMVAIPFHKGMHPYEQMAFQFSHHTVDKTGEIAHKTQFLHLKPGELPNLEFLRALKAALEGDQGTIFRYSNHENTVLCQLHSQLDELNPPDKSELQSFIESITRKRSEDKRTFKWQGQRNMIDQWEQVKKYYWHPEMKGSNSIKKVLPAILNQSKYLQELYSKPNYGKDIKSLNFKNKQWVKLENGRVINPYSSLEPVFTDIDMREFEPEVEFEEINEGGAAATAWARTQFVLMSELERKRIGQALLRYCELDTLAMVMIYQHWRKLLEEANLLPEVA